MVRDWSSNLPFASLFDGGTRESKDEETHHLRMLSGSKWLIHSCSYDVILGSEEGELTFGDPILCLVGMWYEQKGFEPSRRCVVPSRRQIMSWRKWTESGLIPASLGARRSGFLISHSGCVCRSFWLDLDLPDHRRRLGETRACRILAILARNWCQQGKSSLSTTLIMTGLSRP